MELLSIGLGILSFIISIIAIVIGIKSDRKMKAVANLEYDEKLAIMASHMERVKTDKSLGSIERIKKMIFLQSLTFKNIWMIKRKRN